MLEYWRASLHNLSDLNLLALAKDAEYRICSYVSSGNSIDAYVLKQQALWEMIQEELEKR